MAAFPLHNTFWTFTDSNGITTDIISTLGPNTTERYSINTNRGVIAGFGELTISDVRYDDRGTYSCSARNIIGNVSRNATLTVHGE